MKCLAIIFLISLSGCSFSARLEWDGTNQARKEIQLAIDKLLERDDVLAKSVNKLAAEKKG
jgi:hypothetical protein